MSNPNKIVNLDELIRITWMEDMLQGASDETVFSKPVETSMWEAKRGEMINLLYVFTQQLTFGELLAKSLAEQNVAEVLKKTELSGAMLEELKQDKLAVNNVPVMLLKNLLKELRISFTEAQAAILKSFELLQNKVAQAGEQAMLRPIFRKGATEGGGEPFKREPNKDLFENEASLMKYLNRLEKLMN